VHRPSAKSVRLTAMDSTGQVKVFLVMVSFIHNSLVITIQVVTLTLGCSFLCSVPAVWNQLPAVLRVDVGWDAGLRVV
jgi:hypothetical protein